MKEIFLKNKVLIILWLICIAALIVFSGHYGNLLFDVGREVYYPERILEGKVLYRDLFNIYGPFSYLWNAVLYKIFGAKLSTLYISGAVSSIAIVSGVYLIAKKFLNTSLSFAIAFFTIVTGICAPHFFNYTFPYSWAMLYGTAAVIFSVYFLIRYRESEQAKDLCLSGLLAGLAVTNKYDFIIYAGILFLISLFTKNKLNILKFIISMMFFPVISFGVLFIQGLRPEHMIAALQDIRAMMGTITLKYFYMSQGVFFHPLALKLWGITILKTGLPFAAMLLSFRIFDRHKILSTILMTFFGALMYFLTSPEIFAFMLPLIFLLTILGFKKIKNNVTLLLLIISAFALSLKSFWGIIPLNYGNYTLPLVLAAFFSILFTFIDKKYQKIVAVFLMIISLHFLMSFIKTRTLLTGKVNSVHGTIYTYRNNADAMNKVLAILNNHDSNTEAVVYPEGLIINFLSKNRLKSEDRYNSLIPLYMESMGEKNFINMLNEKKPEFVIMNNQSTKDYYFDYICSSYAFRFCQAVRKDYNLEEYIINEGGISYKIYQRKK